MVYQWPRYRCFCWTALMYHGGEPELLPAQERGETALVRRTCLTAWRCKSSTQPDGGEGLAMRKGYRREAGSEGSAEQMCELMDKNRI